LLLLLLLLLLLRPTHTIVNPHRQH
jgi:hypothetical protein